MLFCFCIENDGYIEPRESPVMICGSRPRHRVGALVLTRWKALALGSAEALLQEMLLIMAQIYSNDPRIRHSDNYRCFIIKIISSKQKQSHQQSTSLASIPKKSHGRHNGRHSTRRRLCVAFCKKPTQLLAASKAPLKAAWSCWWRLRRPAGTDLHNPLEGLSCG